MIFIQFFAAASVATLQPLDLLPLPRSVYYSFDRSSASTRYYSSSTWAHSTWHLKPGVSVKKKPLEPPKKAGHSGNKSIKERERKRMEQQLPSTFVVLQRSSDTRANLSHVHCTDTHSRLCFSGVSIQRAESIFICTSLTSRLVVDCRILPGKFSWIFLLPFYGQFFRLLHYLHFTTATTICSKQSQFCPQSKCLFPSFSQWAKSRKEMYLIFNGAGILLLLLLLLF